jgi:hypothetical protein
MRAPAGRDVDLERGMVFAGGPDQGADRILHLHKLLGHSRQRSCRWRYEVDTISTVMIRVGEPLNPNRIGEQQHVKEGLAVHCSRPLASD